MNTATAGLRIANAGAVTTGGNRPSPPRRKGHPGARFHLHGRDGQCCRGLAWQYPGPCLCQRPATSNLDLEPGAHAEALDLSSSTSDGVPAWARRMRRAQTINQGVSAATHAVRGGDSAGGGGSVDLSEASRVLERRYSARFIMRELTGCLTLVTPTGRRPRWRDIQGFRVLVQRHR